MHPVSERGWRAPLAVSVLEIAAVALIPRPTHPPRPTCPQNHVVNKVETNGHRRNWWDAQGFCRADTPLSGGNLVSISDQAEQDWIKDLIQITYQEWTWRPIWIGLNGVWSDEDQHWSDGSAVSYTNWMASKESHRAYWPPVSL